MPFVATGMGGSQNDCPPIRIPGRSVLAVFLRRAFDCPSTSQSRDRGQLSGYVPVAAPVSAVLRGQRTVAPHAGRYAGSFHSAISRQHRPETWELLADPECAPRRLRLFFPSDGLTRAWP